MSTHKVEMSLTVTVVMDEMDGTADQSSEIAMNIVNEQIRGWDGNAQIEYNSVKAEEVPS